MNQYIKVEQDKDYIDESVLLPLIWKYKIHQSPSLTKHIPLCYNTTTSLMFLLLIHHKWNYLEYPFDFFVEQMYCYVATLGSSLKLPCFPVFLFFLFCVNDSQILSTRSTTYSTMQIQVYIHIDIQGSVSNMLTIYYLQKVIDVYIEIYISIL